MEDLASSLLSRGSPSSAQTSSVRDELREAPSYAEIACQTQPFDFDQETESYVMVALPTIESIGHETKAEREALNYGRMNGAIWVLGDIAYIGKQTHNWIRIAQGHQVMDPHFTLGLGSISALGLFTGSVGIAESVKRYQVASKSDHTREKVCALVAGSRYFASTVSGGSALAYRISEFHTSQTASKSSLAAQRALGFAASGLGVFVYSAIGGLSAYGLAKAAMRSRELKGVLESGKNGFQYLVGQMALTDRCKAEAFAAAMKSRERPEKLHFKYAMYVLDHKAQEFLIEKTKAHDESSGVGKDAFSARLRAELVKRSKAREHNFASDISPTHMKRVREYAIHDLLPLTEEEQESVLSGLTQSDFNAEHGEVELHPVDTLFASQKSDEVCDRFGVDPSVARKTLRGKLAQKVEEVKGEIVQEAQNSMRTNVLFSIAAVAVCVVGAAVTAASMVVTGGLAGLVVAIIGDAVAVSMLGVDLYGLASAFKNGDAGRYDHLLLTAVSVAMVAAIVIATLFSSGLLPLIIAGVSGLTLLALQGYLIYKTRRDQEAPLKGVDNHFMIGTSVNAGLEVGI